MIVTVLNVSVVKDTLVTVTAVTVTVTVVKMKEGTLT